MNSNIQIQSGIYMSIQARKKKLGIELRESTIPGAGVGVFTTRPFHRGELICHYGGETVHRSAKSKEEMIYSIAHPVVEGCWRIGSRTDRKNLGHFINDGSAFILHESLRDKKSGLFPIYSSKVQKAITDYTEQSNQRSNVIFIDKEFGMGARCDIEAGQELFYSYGLNYWCCLQELETEEIFTRISYMILGGFLLEKNNDFFLNNKLVEDYQYLLQKVLRVHPEGNVVHCLGIADLSMKEKCHYLVQKVL